MTGYLRIFGALLASLALLLAGIGLQNTLIGIRAGIEGFSTTVTGWLMSAYFLGYLGGCLIVPGFIVRVGHIRTFALLASLNAAVAVMLAIAPTPPVYCAHSAGVGSAAARHRHGDGRALPGC